MDADNQPDLKRPPGPRRSRVVLSCGFALAVLVALAAALLLQDVSAAAVRDDDALLAAWRRAGLTFGGLTFASIAAILGTTVLLARLVERQERTLAALLLARQESEEAAAAKSAVLDRLRASQARLNEKSQVLELTLDHIDQGLLMIDAGSRVAVYNHRLLELLDLPDNLLARRPLFSEIVAHQRAQGEFVTARVTAQHVPGEGLVLNRPSTFERVRPNGRVLEVQTIPLPQGGMVRTFTDITERRASEQRIRHLAHHDALTPLVNRVIFRQCLDEALALAKARQGRVAVLYLDLDGFKLINDTHGHAIGDLLLIEVAQRLLDAVRPGDTVARMGGDEFAIIQPLVRGLDEPEQLARRIIGRIAEPFVIDDLRCLVGVSIGIVLFPDHADTMEALLADADAALYRAKAGGKGAYAAYDPLMDRPRRDTLQLEQELKLALPAQEFFLEYQPIVDMATRAPVCHEALLRWRHPVRGVLGPGTFVELAERSGVIVRLGAWVLQTACAAAAAQGADMGVAVNVSPIQFTRADLVHQVRDALDRSGLAPHRLTLEVTEGVMLDSTAGVYETMTALRAMGVRFSLDDFGTAQSRLSYLRQFPFDVVKIDKSFVQDAVSDEGSRAIVAAVIAIGRAFRLTVVAEGLEREEQFELLHEMGCPLGQGWLLGRPAPTFRVGAPNA